MNYTWERKVLISLAMGLLTFLGASLSGCGDNEVSKVEEPKVSNAPQPGRVLEPEDKTLKLTVPELERVENLPVYGGDMEEALRKSAYFEPRSDYPWFYAVQDTNTYIAGHRLGYPGTKSWRVFDDLGKLENGDKIFVETSEGRVFEYEVYSKDIVAPNAIEVLEPVEGKDIVTLQTCTLPAYKDRIIVRGELVEN